MMILIFSFHSLCFSMVKMESARLFLVLITFLSCCDVSEQVVISDSEIQNYVNQVISEFQENPSSERFDHVIHPPRLRSTQQALHVLPKIFIWCPMEHFNLQISCPVHGIPMKAGIFTDQLLKKSPRNPRLVYDVRSNILLIQRLYVCQRGRSQHRYLSSSMDVLQNIPKLYGSACFPIVLFFRSACTKELVDFIETQVLQGVSFLQICNGLATMNYNEYRERTECQSILEDCATGVDYLEGFYSDELFSFPSNDKLMNIFLADFYRKRYAYRQQVENLARVSKCLACDHTFKIARYIGASRGSDNKFVKQFENLYIMMNENRQIIGWRLTKTTAFHEIDDLLKDFKNVLTEDLQMVIVDDCCKVRALYQEIFPNVNVKLDVFHGVQRIVKTFPKGTEVSKQISKDFGLIFRMDGDCGQDREHPTPDPEIIERNLNNFVTRWSEVLRCDSQAKTLHEIYNLRKHIQQGCLSEIPPGMGTECNERLHHTINDSLLCGASTISPEMAISVLCLIFYGINCKKVGKKHQKNARIVPFIPLPKHSLPKEDEQTDKYMKTFFKAREGELEGSKVWDRNNVKTEDIGVQTGPSILIAEEIEDLLNGVVSTMICENTINLYETLEKVDIQCNDRSLNVQDIPIMQLFGAKNVLMPEDGMNDDSEREHELLLSRNLRSFNLCIDKVDGDGDCAFATIIKQLRKSREWQSGSNEMLLKHVTDLGLGKTVEEDVYSLRQLFVDMIQSNEHYQMLLGVNVTDLNYETERFRSEGTFCGEMGDLIMKVCSEILQVPFLVITSIPGCPHLPFIPEKQVTTETLFMSFNAYGPGHYDGTSTVESKDEHQSNVKGPRCSCGRNKKDQNVASCLQPTDESNQTRGRRCPCISLSVSCGNECRCRGCMNVTTVDRQVQALSCRCGESGGVDSNSCMHTDQRKSRCPCLKNQQQCGERCLCKNCKNVFGSNNRKSDTTLSTPKKRKRSNPSPYKKLKSVEFLKKSNCEPTSSLWSCYETCLLFCTMSTLVSTSVPLSVNSITTLYNHVVKSDACEATNLPVRPKNNAQIQGKLQHLEEKQMVAATKVQQ